MIMTQEEVLKEVTHLLDVAKEVNYDVVELYAKEPLAMQIIGGTVVGSFVLMMIIKSMLKKSGASKALRNMDNEEDSFDSYQKNLNKILNVISSANSEFIENLKQNKEHYYELELNSIKELSIVDKIRNYQEMSELYYKLSNATRDEELAEFYSQKSQELVDVKLIDEIREYLNNFSFDEDGVIGLENIVVYAQTQDEPEVVLNIVKSKLDSVDFGSSLEIFTFVRGLDDSRLGEIYDYCVEKQEELFKNGNSAVSGEILEYLMQNDEKQRVLSYVKTLKIATFLQELNYKYFTQVDEEFDLAFIANPTEINNNYATYIEEMITNSWRDEERLSTILEFENVTNVIGHDRARNVIERIDSLKEETKQNDMLEEAISTAKEAIEIAKEAKELAISSSQKELTSQE